MDSKAPTKVEQLNLKSVPVSTSRGHFYLIDPDAQSIVEIAKPTIADTCRHLDCHAVSGVFPCIDGTIWTVYHDDEGMLKAASRGFNNVFATLIPDTPPLVGKLVICRLKGDRDSGLRLNLQQIRKLIKFAPARSMEALYHNAT